MNTHAQQRREFRKAMRVIREAIRANHSKRMKG